MASRTFPYLAARAAGAGAVLDGAKLDEISRRLQIAYSTIAHHIRSMIDKTGSRNRTELIARVLGWENT
jgi:DNA-binding CsgD family transcriptional regulator